MSGMTVRLACPPGYGPTDVDLDRLRALGCGPFVTTHPTRRPRAPTPCTPTSGRRWASRPRRDQRSRAFEGFQVDDR